MILRHRDKELLRFEWVGDVRVRIVSVNEAERKFLPLEFGDERLGCETDALRHPLEDWLASRSAPVGRHYNWTDERRTVLSGFLQKRASDIRRFGREVDEKDEQSLNVEALNSNENVGVKSSSKSGLNASPRIG